MRGKGDRPPNGKSNPILSAKHPVTHVPGSSEWCKKTAPPRVTRSDHKHHQDLLTPSRNCDEGIDRDRAASGLETVSMLHYNNAIYRLSYRIMRLPKTAIHHALLWTTVICILFVQGAGGRNVLCLGCADFPGGVALKTASCSPVNDCCTPQSGKAPSNSEGGDADQAPDRCACVEIAHSTFDGTSTPSPVPIALHPSYFTFLPDAMPAVSTVLAAPRWGARAGPPMARLLSPAARHTIHLL